MRVSIITFTSAAVAAAFVAAAAAFPDVVSKKT